MSLNFQSSKWAFNNVLRLLCTLSQFSLTKQYELGIDVLIEKMMKWGIENSQSWWLAELLSICYMPAPFSSVDTMLFLHIPNLTELEVTDSMPFFLFIVASWITYPLSLAPQPENHKTTTKQTHKVKHKSSGCTTQNSLAPGILDLPSPLFTEYFNSWPFLSLPLLLLIFGPFQIW